MVFSFAWGGIRPRVSGRGRAHRLSTLLVASVGFVGLASAPASAASNPGTGDSGFFTFRPADGVGGTQINVASGNALIRTRDLVDGPLAYHVVVDRAYNSLSPDAFTILSPRWGFDVGPDTKLTVESNQDATVRGPSAYRIRFERQPDGSYVAPEDFDGALVKTPSGWTLTRASQNDEFGFDGSGNLTWTKDSSLRDFTVQGTSAAGRTVLSSYGTSSGRRVNLSYNGDSLVRLMDDPASGHHSYRYTGGRLTEYESPTGAKTTYGYDANGFLDEIVEPGGTTVELDVTASGKVHSITTTLPGGVPQTTSFVYTRRTYKTDVTAPDTTRRTYAYDDDWRVTRDYDPDVVPTVTASGELKDLEGGYVGPNRTYPVTVSATQPDGAGLRRLLVERSGGAEIEGEDVPCTTTPFDLVCPTSRTANLDVSFVNVPEGEQTIRAAADDDEEHHATSDGWKVLVDKTPPNVAAGFTLSYFDPEDVGASATVTWSEGSDPDLDDGKPGAGIELTEVRYRVNSGPFGAWEESASGDVAVEGGSDDDVITIEVRATDAVGNVSATGVGSVVLREQLEDPDVQELAIDSYVESHGTSRVVAAQWLALQDRAKGISTEIATRRSGGYAGVWFDNDDRRIKVGVRIGANAVPAEQALAERGLAARSDIVRTAHTQAQLEQAQPPIEEALDDLVEQGLVTIGRRPSANSIVITVAADATSSDRSRVQDEADASAVTVIVVDSDEENLGTEAVACSFPNCDAPIRAGVKIDRDPAPSPCTAGFVSRLRATGALYVMTAGHCIYSRNSGHMSLAWKATAASGKWKGISPSLGKPHGVFYIADSGDVGLIEVSGPYWRQGIGATVFVKRTGSTQLDPSYDIRGVEANLQGKTVCMTGHVSGTRCGKVFDTNQKITVDNLIVKHAALVSMCGVERGDSGGPMYKGHRAMGIAISRRGCVAYMQGASRAQELLGFDILLRR